MQFCLFEDHSHKQLLPLTYTRAVADLRICLSTIIDKWQHLLKQNIYVQTQEYLQQGSLPVNGPVFYINSALIPNENLVNAILDLKDGESLKYEEKLIAINTQEVLKSIDPENITKGRAWEEESILIQRPWDLFFYNDQVLKINL